MPVCWVAAVLYGGFCWVAALLYGDLCWAADYCMENSAVIQPGCEWRSCWVAAVLYVGLTAGLVQYYNRNCDKFLMFCMQHSSRLWRTFAQPKDRIQSIQKHLLIWLFVIQLHLSLSVNDDFSGCGLQLGNAGGLAQNYVRWKSFCWLPTLRKELGALVTHIVLYG